MTQPIPQPFRIDIPQHRLDDLKQRLHNVRWPQDLGNDDWRYGVNRAYLEDLVAYWRDSYDWRAQEAKMNAWPHFRVELDGIPIHFIHARGKGPNPTPLILTHGWPWTFWDFHRVIGPLTDPAAYGGDPADAFDVIVPSLPGFGFSTPLPRAGINWMTTADLWARLMRDVLGYERFAVHGADWGVAVSTQLAHKYGDAVIGLHAVRPMRFPLFNPEQPWSLSGKVASIPDANLRKQFYEWERHHLSHLVVQMLDPQTLAYAMHDSPVGMCAWILERRRSWSDCNGDVESRFPRDDLLTTMSIYWLTDSFVGSVRFYAEGATPWQPSHSRQPVVEVPTGITLFSADPSPLPSTGMEDFFNVKQLREHASGGHFAAAEEPEAIVTDIRDLFRPLRGSKP